ncbi:DUF6152 family protein [Tsuneonella sp. HG222]
MRTTLKLALAVALAVPIPVLAHHSFAMFDMQRTVRLNATVVKFKWQNPHAWLEVDAATVGGASERWAIELTSPNNLAQEGWTRTSVKLADRVTLYVYPLRNGAKGGSFRGVRLANGSTLGQVD